MIITVSLVNMDFFCFVLLLCNVVLVSTVLQNPLLEHVYPLCRHRALSGAPSATQRVLSYLLDA